MATNQQQLQGEPQHVGRAAIIGVVVVTSIGLVLGFTIVHWLVPDVIPELPQGRWARQLVMGSVALVVGVTPLIALLQGVAWQLRHDRVQATVALQQSMVGFLVILATLALLGVQALSFVPWLVLMVLLGLLLGLGFPVGVLLGRSILRRIARTERPPAPTGQRP